jgi:DNA polymerase-1
MIDVDKALCELSSSSGSAGRMILTVHDELLFEVPAGRADEVAAVIRARMEGAASLAIPLTVDIGIGANWKDAKD